MALDPLLAAEAWQTHAVMCRQIIRVTVLIFLLSTPSRAFDRAAFMARIDQAKAAGPAALEHLVRELAADQTCTTDVLGWASVCLAELDPRRVLETIGAQGARGGEHQLGILRILMNRPNVMKVTPAWLREHAGDPAFDPIAAAMVYGLLWRDPLAARQWAAQIKDDALRQHVQSAL